MEKKERKSTMDMIKESVNDSLYPIFGKYYTDIIVEAIVEEVLNEYIEAADGDADKALRYVLLDKLGFENV